MGGGASTVTIEERITKDAPVEFPDLQLDGTVNSRDEYHGGRPGFHRRASTSPLAPKVRSPQQPSALELQAAAHWHRLIEHALSDQPLQLKKPRCPECARGDHEGPYCSICGIDISLKPPLSPRDEDNEKESSPSQTFTPVVRWNASAQEYERMLVSNQKDMLDDQKITDSQSDEKQNDIAEYKNHRIQAEIGYPDVDKVQTEIISDMLKTAASGLRRRSSVEVSNITKMGAEAARDEIRKQALAEEKERAKLEISEKELRKKDRANKMNRLFADETGEESESTSPIRALRGKDVNDVDKDIDVDEDGIEIDYEGPDNELPEVQIELKSRTSSTITLSWDTNALAQEALEDIRKFHHDNKSPTYELMFRIHSDKKGGGDNPWILGYPRTRKFGGTVEFLIANTPYVFRCRRIGWGGWGPSVVIRTGPGPPSAPKSLCAKEVTSSSILITWQLPEKDNGLPILEYSVRMKAWGGEFQDIYRGKDRLFLATGLTSNLVHIFEVKAGNKMGFGIADDKLAIRTLPPGAANLTPWVEAIDEKTGKIFYCHTKTNETAWTIPTGVILDEAGSLKNKHYYLKNQMRKRSVQACNDLGTHSHVIQLEVKRGNLLEESLQQIFAKDKEEIDAGPIRVKYQNEEGLDAGGLAKDWFSEVSRNLLEGSTGLLIQNEHGFATIDPRAVIIHKPSESRWLFKALGIFFAKALIDGQTLGMTLNPTILMLMCDKTPTLEHLKDVDPSFYRGLKWVEENNVEGADLTFSASYELFGSNETIKFIENGDTVTVTEENKEEYLDLIQQWLFRGRYEPGLTHLLEGFHRHIPTKELEHFSLDEIQLIMGGRASIDASDIQKDVEFAGGFDESSPQVCWLWDVLAEFDQESLSRFLSFVTGCPSLPVDGLQPPLMLTHTEGTDSVLPRAHTCFNQLVLPKYSSFEILKERLTYALMNSNEEFHMA